MDFLNLAEERFSVRSYDSKKLSQEEIKKILKAGYVAPTGCNNQPQRVLVMQSEEALEKLKKCTRCHFDAPCAMLVCYNNDECWTRPFDGETCGTVDVSIVATHMMLQAWEMGIGSCMVMFFDPAQMKKEFNIPENIKPILLLTLGYPSADSKPSERHSQYRDESEIIAEESF